MVDAPPPRSVSGTVSTGSVWNRRFVCPTVLPQKLCFCNPLGCPTVQVPFSQIDMPVCPLKSQISSSTGHPDKRALCGALCRASHRHPAWRPASPLYLGISLFCGQQRSVWKRSSDSPLRAFTESFNPGLLSQRRLESSPALIPSTFNSLVCDMSLLLNQIKKICYLFFINT